MLELNLYLQSAGNPLLDKLFLYISYLVTDVPLVAILCYVYWCISKDKGIRMGFILLNGMQLNFIVKDIFKIERPYVRNELIVNKDTEYGYGYSFPSNHSQFISSFLFSLKKYFCIGKLFIPGFLLMLLVGFSRIYLGVHSVIDVLTGFVFGYIIVKVLGIIIDKIMNSGKYLYAFIFLILGFIGMFLFDDKDSFKITYIYFGFLVGFLIENKYIKYTVPKKPIQKLLNYIVGIAGIAVIYILIKSDIKYLFIGIWVTLPAPLIFKFLRKENKK